MKRIIRFSRLFIPTAIFTTLLIGVCIAGYFIKGGFNLGVDFKAGLMQEVQFAPNALALTYSGKGNAVISYSVTGVNIIITGTSAENAPYSFSYTMYPTLSDIATAMQESITGLSVVVNAPGDTESKWLLESAQGNPQLGSIPYNLHYLRPGSPPVDISDVRSALSPLGVVAVQVLGTPEERRFMIRMEDDENSGGVPPEAVIKSLQDKFGVGEVSVQNSQYVESRFSQQLQTQAAFLMCLTLLVIFCYSAIRFKPQFAFGAVIATTHDAIVMIGFIIWSRMEFNTTTIAAILTILGYSINDTIVVFDRVRETRRLYREDSYRNVIDRAVSETLGRTIITSVTTMLAVLSLYIFTTGSMKDFALALLVGMVCGVYSTIFVASGFTLFWEDHIKNKLNKKKKTALTTASDSV